jgi:hypothetical protein
VCEPAPAALAAALRQVMRGEGIAERMGTAAFTAGARLNWSEAVSVLTT